MLNHKRLKIAGGLVLIICLIMDWFLPVHWGIYLVFGLTFLGIIAYGSANIQSQFFVSAICSGATDQRKIALTFDDGPDPEVTPLVLDVLKKNETPAAFFCIGHKMENHPELLQRIDQEGHLTGNHSFSHSYLFDLLPAGKVRLELEQTNNALQKAIGKRTHFFRPPYGVTNPAIAKAVKQLGHKVIGWNVRSLDTVIKDKQQLLDRIKKKLKPGSIILLHDTQAALPGILSDLLAYLKQEHYQVVRLDALIGEEAQVNQTEVG